MPFFHAQRAAIALASFAALALVLAACSGEDDAGDRPVSVTPGAVVTMGDLPLHAARIDLGQRTGIPATDVRLRSLEQVGWDGCAGVKLPDKPCAELFGAGSIARFEAAEKPYRYHILGDAVYATDFIPGATLDDGSPLPPKMAIDLVAVLAEYARLDLVRLREKEIGRPVTARVIAIVPALFPDGCMGFQPEGQGACTQAIVSGAVVLIGASDGKTYRYHVAPTGGVVATDFVPGKVTWQMDQAVVDVQEAMRKDLAQRLGQPLDQVSLRTFREVTWPDGCIGISRPGQLCTQALVDGFLAILAGPDGKEYRYHGVRDNFVAASFAGGTITEPLPE